jgi:hypothetical protein
MVTDWSNAKVRSGKYARLSVYNHIILSQTMTVTDIDNTDVQSFKPNAAFSSKPVSDDYATQ